MSFDGYRFSAEYLTELQAAVAEALDVGRQTEFIHAADERATALAAALEGPAGHPTDPPPSV